MNSFRCPASALQDDPASSLTKILSAPILATPTKILLDPFALLDPESKVIHAIPMGSSPIPDVSLGVCSYVPTEGKLVTFDQVKPASADLQRPFPDRAPK